MKLCLLLLLLLPTGIAAQESPKPEPKAQDAEQKKAELHAKLVQAAQEYARQAQVAIANAQQEIASHPDSAQAHFHLAEVLREGPQQPDDRPKIVDEYRRAIQLKPDYAKAYLGLAVTFRQMGEYDKAYGCLNKAIQLKPDYTEAYVNLAAAYLDGDRYVDARKVPVTKEDATHAIEALKKAINLRPDFAESYTELGLAYTYLDKWNEAAEAFKQAILFSPNDRLSFYALCRSYIELGNKEAAMQAYRNLKEISDGLEKSMKEAGYDDVEASVVTFYTQRALKEIEERFGNN